MSDAYHLPKRKRSVCRVAGAIFLLFAACTALQGVILSAWPGPVFDCVDGCRWRSEPTRMLDDDEQAKVVVTPGADRAIAAHVARPIVRAGIFGVSMIEAAPFALLLAGVGLALLRLGGRGSDPIAEALPWLRRGSLAAIVWAVSQPVSQSLMASLMSPGTPSGPHWYIQVDLVDVATGLMLAIAAYAAIWALEAGLQAQRDLAEIV